MSTIEEAREQARAAQEQISNRLIGSRLGLSSTREMDKDMLAMSSGLDALSALMDATEPSAQRDRDPRQRAEYLAASKAEHALAHGRATVRLNSGDKALTTAVGGVIYTGYQSGADPYELAAQILALLAGEVRRHCTPSPEAYRAGGDQLIGAVADWLAPVPRAVGAVAQPDKPAEDEREALFIARNIINQIADRYHERIPSPDWVRVRQETNDELDEFAVRLIAGYRRGSRLVTEGQS